MKHLVRISLLACVVALTSVNAFAQEFRIGFVNLARLLAEANTAKSANAKLEQEFSKREKELNDLGTALKSAVEKLERDAPTLSEAQRNVRQRQIADQEREFQRRRREFQEDLTARKNEELQQVLERANKVVKQVAETEKYDVILQEFVYMNPKLDITDRVLKAMNATK